MKKLNIFIVEDEGIVAKDIQNSLTRLGYNVVGIANNGKDALEKIISLEPDLVLMDIMIKGNMTGIEASQKLKNKINIPIIFLTAYADESTLSSAKISEPYGYILKPFKEIDLHAGIEMAIYKHGKDAEVKKERDLLYSLVENKDEKYSDTLFVKTGTQLVKVMLKDIYYVEAQKDYVIINTKKAHYTVHSTMKDIDKKFGNADFIRTHRSFIVRLDKIHSIKLQKVILEGDDKKVIPIGEAFNNDVMKRLNML